jgi:hypothetical protein
MNIEQTVTDIRVDPVALEPVNRISGANAALF